MAKAKALAPLAIDRDTRLDCDVVIVGSWAGGGTVAGCWPEPDSM